VVLRYTLYPDDESATECATPAPDGPITAGEPVALLTIEMLPFKLPAAVGSNVTDSVSFCEGARVTGVAPPLSK